MVSLAAKLVRSLAFVAAFCVAGVMITPGCAYRRCDDERRRCDEACYYRCDRSGCYPVCGIRCRTYCNDRNFGAPADDVTQSELVTKHDPVCEYDDDCSGGLSCVEREGERARTCETRR